EEVSEVYEQLLEDEFRKAVTEENLRPDGRGTTDIRQLAIEVGVLPRTHGSAVFTRGQTQVLSVATLGPGGDEQIIDTLSPVDTKRYMHHYNFPPYSVGEVRMMRGAGRREIGQGRHRPPNGHQDQGDLARHHASGIPAGARGASPHPRGDAQRHRSATLRAVPLRAADRNDQDPAGQGARGHRPRRQDGPRDPG